MVIEILKTIILGIVQGVTEWLPVSSTGHMILVEAFLQLDYSQEFREVFFVVIQFASILAVIILFWNKIFPFDVKRGFRPDMDKFQLWFKILVACLPAAVIGILFDDVLDELFFNPLTVATTLIGYGILFIIVENMIKGHRPRITDLNQITYKFAMGIGLFQLLALIPGTSRSGATIIGGLMLGASRYIASEFTFFLAIPVMAGASLLRIVRVGLDFTTEEWLVMGVGSLVAFLVSIITIKFLLGYIKRNNFKVFGYYRILAGILVLIFLYLGMIS